MVQTRVAAWLQLELDKETRGSEMEGVPIYMMYSSFYVSTYMMISRTLINI
jgi:hypothetical protein